MNKRPWCRWAIISVLLLGLPGTAAAEPKVHQSGEFDYSIAVPDGWTAQTKAELPPGFVENMRQRVTEMGNAGGSEHFKAFDTDLLIQRDAQAPPLTPPFAFVMGLHWQDVDIPEDKVHDVYIGGAKALRKMMAVRDVDIGVRLPAVEPGEVLFDTSGMQYVQSMNEEFTTGFVWMKYGRRSLLMLTFAVPAGEDGTKARQAIARSFRWDEDASLGSDEATAESAQESNTDAYSYEREGARLAKFVMTFLLVLVIGGVLAYVWRNRRVEYTIPDDDSDRSDEQR